MKIAISVFLLLIIAAPFVNAQVKSQPLKFDEFSNEVRTVSYPYREVTAKTHIDRFVKEIKKRVNSKVFIVVYQGKQVDGYKRYEINNLAEQVEWLVRDIKGFNEENISILEGGFREQPSLEFWIGNKNSMPPVPTPTVSKEDTFSCPRVSISPDGFRFDKASSVIFRLYVSEGFSPSIQWTVSSGKIVSGQNTNTITVDSLDSKSTSITANVVLDGLPLLCQRATSSTVALGLKPFLFDSTDNYLFSDLHARIDAFMVALNNNPELTGYIIGYAGRRTGPVAVDRALAVVTRVFNFRKYHSERVKLINGGYREFNSVDMWLLPPGAAPPALTPSVDAKFIKVSPRKVNLGEW